jgi:hypothetical protein
VGRRISGVIAVGGSKIAGFFGSSRRIFSSLNRIKSGVLNYDWGSGELAFADSTGSE